MPPDPQSAGLTAHTEGQGSSATVAEGAHGLALLVSNKGRSMGEAAEVYKVLPDPQTGEPPVVGAGTYGAVVRGVHPRTAHALLALAV